MVCLPVVPGSARRQFVHAARAEELSMRQCLADWNDYQCFLQCVRTRRSPLLVRHAVYATQGMSVAEAVEFWDSHMLDRALNRPSLVSR